jgi:hypothetical protein
LVRARKRWPLGGLSWGVSNAHERQGLSSPTLFLSAENDWRKGAFLFIRRRESNPSHLLVYAYSPFTVVLSVYPSSQVNSDVYYDCSCGKNGKYSAEADLLQCDVCKAWVHVKCDETFRSRPRPRNHRVFVCLKCNTFRSDVHTEGGPLDTFDAPQRVHFCSEPPRFVVYSKRASTSSLLGNSFLVGDGIPSKRPTKSKGRPSDDQNKVSDFSLENSSPSEAAAVALDPTPLDALCSSESLKHALFEPALGSDT